MKKIIYALTVLAVFMLTSCDGTIKKEAELLKYIEIDEKGYVWCIDKTIESIEIPNEIKGIEVIGIGYEGLGIA